MDGRASAPQALIHGDKNERGDLGGGGGAGEGRGINPPGTYVGSPLDLNHLDGL